MNIHVALWVGFNLVVLALLALDLGVFHRKDHVVSPKEALLWTGIWVVLSMLFCGALWGSGHWSRDEATQWVTAYVVEYALSVDNLFVFLLVFGYFRVDPKVQHRVLFWGILGAFVMRAVLIVTGTALVRRFHWLLYLFGAFLVFTAVKMAFSKDDDEENDPEKGLVVRAARRLLPVARQGEGHHFFMREEGRLKVTPLFLVLLVVEFTDLLFALDSIPAVLGLSQNAFLVYSSNVCAILGLRSLFFVVSSLMEKFHLLKVGLGFILAFVGVKMLIVFFDIHLSTALSLGVIAGVLVLSMLASLVWPKRPRTSPT